MKPIDPFKLQQDIEAIPGICQEGKMAIKRLFTNHFEVDFQTPVAVTVGQIWAFSQNRFSGKGSAPSNYDAILMVVRHTDGKLDLLVVDGGTERRIGYMWYSENSDKALALREIKAELCPNYFVHIGMRV